MKVLLKKTFIKSFHPIMLGCVSLISLLSGFLLSKEYHNLIANKPTYDYLSNRLGAVIAIIYFIMIIGFVFWIIISQISTGLFASEIHEGTIRLLLSKAISRKELVFGKVGGMLLAGLVYLLIAMLLFMTSFSLFTSIDQDLLIYFYKITFASYLYGVFVLFIVGGIGSLLSTCFKKKVPALLVILLIAMVCYAIFPILRNILSANYYYRYHIYLIDINYHFGLIYQSFLDFFTQFDLSSGQKMMYAFFTNVYKATALDIDINTAGASFYSLNTTLSSLGVFITYLIIDLASYILSLKRMCKMDV